MNYRYRNLKDFREPTKDEVLQISEMYLYGGKRIRIEGVRKLINVFLSITSGFFLLVTLGWVFYQRNDPAFSKELITELDFALISFWLVWGTIHCFVIYENCVDKAFKKGKFAVLDGIALKYIPPVFPEGETVIQDGLSVYSAGTTTLGRIDFQAQDGHIITAVKVDIGGSFIPKENEKYKNFDVYLVVCRGRVRAFTNWNCATEEMKSCYRPFKA